MLLNENKNQKYFNNFQRDSFLLFVISFTANDTRELNIPNTTNAIDDHFADLKNKLRNHNGLSLDRKMKFIDAFLKV